MIKLKSLIPLFEADIPDDQMIDYKQDGETKQMPAKSAKTMGMDHPAKQAYDSLAKGDEKGAEKKGVNIFDKPADKPADKPKPKKGKPWHKISGDDTMGHLSTKLKHKVLHSMEDVNLSHSQKFDLEVDDEGNVTYDGEVVAKIEDDTTHEDLRNQIKSGVTAMFKRDEPDEDYDLYSFRIDEYGAKGTT